MEVPVIQIDSEPETLNEQDEDSKAEDPNELVEDSKPQDLTEQSKDETETPQQPSQEGEDPLTETYPLTSLSHSSEKSSVGSRTNQLSSLLATQPSSTSPHIFRLSSANKFQDLLDPSTETESEVLLESSELPSDFGAFSSSAWEETAWTQDVPSCPAPERKRSFHDCCCCSVIEQMIKHSPERFAKAPFHRSFKKQQASKRKQISVSSERLRKQKYPVGVMKKKEYKAFSKVQTPPTTSSVSFKESDRCSGRSRRSKALYSLYTTFYDEAERFDGSFLGEKGSLITSELKITSGLTRACTIFSSIKNGKINACNLLLTLHTLGIMMTLAELQQVLKSVAVDAHGNLEFADFLGVISNVLPFSATRAFSTALQIAQDVFRKIKRDMVAVEELEPTLTSLGVTLSPKTIERALKQTRVTWDGKLNISDFLLTVNGPLSRHSRVASLNECASLQRTSHLSTSEPKTESSLDQELPARPSVTFYDADQEFTLAQLQGDPSEPQRSGVDLQRPRTAPLPRPAEEEKSKPLLAWPKVRPAFGYSSQDTMFPLSSSLSFKEEAKKLTPSSLSWSPGQDYTPMSAAQMKMRAAALEQRRKKQLSFPDELPRRYDPEGNEKQKSDSKSAKSQGKEGSGGLSVEQFSKALQDAFKFINNLKGDDISVEEMRFDLTKMGVSLSEQEFQEVLKRAGVTSNKMVNFNSFMNALGKTRRFTEFSTLKDTIQAIDKIEGDKVVLHELPSFMKNMGINLSDKDFQQALKQVSVDESGKIVVKDFIKTLTNSPHFSELSVLKDTIQAVSCIRSDKVSLEDLRHTLKKMGVHLNPQEYEELIKTTPIDSEGKVDIGKIMKKIAKTQRFSEMEVLNNAVKAFSQLKDDKLKLSEVESYLDSIGVHLTKPELAETTKSLHVAPDGTIDINELISAMKGTRRFTNYSAVHDAIHALKVIKEHGGTTLKRERSSMHMFGLQFANQVITHVLKSAHVTETGQTKFNDFLRTLTRNPKFKTSAALLDGFGILSKLENYMIGVEELKVVMKNFNITLPTDEVSEALAFCTIDENGKVNLKDFLRGVTHTTTFLLSPELQLTSMALSKLKGEQFDLHALEFVLDDMDLLEAKDILQEVMKTAKVDSNGKVNFREFMRIFTLLPQVPDTMVLKDTFNAMSDMKDRHFHVDDLEQTLINVGINLLPDELRELMQSVTVAGDGTVSFKDIMMNLTGTQSFAEFSAVQNAFNVFNKICREKVKKEELPGVLKDLGITLSAEKLQVALASAAVDASGKLNGTEVMKILSDSPCFSEFKALQDAMKVVENIKSKKMTVTQLEETLDGMGVHLPSTTFNEVVRSAKTDENGEIDFQDFLLALGETEEFNDVETLQRAITIITAMHGSRLNMNELESTLQNLGIYLKPDELQKAMHASHVDSNGTVNLKDFLLSLAEIEHFSDSVALHSAIKAFGRIKDEKVDIEELESVVEGLGISVSNTELQDALKNTPVDANGKVDFKEFLMSMMDNERFSGSSAVHGAYSVIGKVCDDKIEVSQLKDALAALGIVLTTEEMREALKNVTVDSDGKVNLKEFMNGLPHTKRFFATEEMEGAMKTLKSIKQDKVNVEELDSIMRSMGLHLSPQEIQEMLKYVTKNDDGTVSVKDCMFALSKTRRHSQSERDKISIQNLDSILENMGINLTKEEMREALRHVQIDADGKVNLNEFLKVLRGMEHPSFLEGAQGDVVDVKDVGSLLSGMGIHLTKEQLEEALKHVTVDENGKLNMGELMNRVKTQRLLEAERKMVGMDDLSATLAKMGIHLTEKEMKEALKHITIDADGNVNLKKVLESVMATRQPSKFERDRVAVEDVNEILASLGITLTEEEMREALKHAPLDAEGKVNLGELMKAVRAIQSKPPAGKMVGIDDLSATLAKMGIHLTEKEMKEALKHITIDADGNVNLKKVLERVMATRQPSKFERDRVAVEDVNEILASLGITLTEEEMREALKHAPLDAEGKVNLGELMKAVRAIQSKPPAGKMVGMDDLSATLAKMGIHLTEKEMKEALKHITIDADGNVNLKKVLESVMATRQPSKFERDRVAVGDLNDILSSLGITLTEEEMREALKHAPRDAEGKVNLGEFMKAVRAIQPQTGDGKTLSKGSMKTLRKLSLDEKQKIAVQDLASILASKGIYLNDKELQEALKHVEVNADGTVKLGEFLNGLREVRGLPPAADGKMGLDDLKGAKGELQKIPRIIVDEWPEDKKVDIDSLDAILAAMGIHLTNKQLHEALKYAPMDADGKVDLEAFKKGVNAVLRGPQTEKRVNISALNFVLIGMGLRLTSAELEEALKLTVHNKDGTVNLKDFMWALHDLPSIQDKKVDVSNLISILSAMGIYLTLDELEDMLERTPRNEDGTVNLKDFIKACSATLVLCSRQGKHLNQVSDAAMLKLPKVTEKHHLQSVSKLLSSEAFSERTKFKAARSLNHGQLEAFHNAYDTFSKDLDGYIDLPALETTAFNLGISLTEEEAFDELMYADTDGDGRVNFTDFLNIVTDIKRFEQAVAPKKSDMETVDARGILFFELLSKLVESCLLSKKATETIVSYYRHKFLESTGKRAWRADSTSAKSHKKKGGLKKAKSTSIMSAFAGAARICVMKDKELRSYVQQLQESIPPSDSPYGQVPIFPLIPNHDGRMHGKPKKDLRKLEKQRRMEPVSSFEDHFFQKKRWLNEAKSVKTSKPSLTLSPDLAKGRRRLTIDNLKEIRLEVKKATDSYRRSIALRERNKSLTLWRRLRGGEIGLETGNPSFYQTFSTYSWSWNVCQELLTPRELQEYDNKLYKGLSHSATSSDKQSRSGGRHKGSSKK